MRSSIQEDAIRLLHGNAEGRFRMASPAGVSGGITVMISAWERNVVFKMFSHEEALATDQIVASWCSQAPRWGQTK
jgi:hypothetical protein